MLLLPHVVHVYQPILQMSMMDKEKLSISFYTEEEKIS